MKCFAIFFLLTTKNITIFSEMLVRHHPKSDIRDVRVCPVRPFPYAHGLRHGWLSLRPGWLGLKPGWMAQRGGCKDEWMENLPILQDFVPYRGRCPKTAITARKLKEMKT